MPLTKGFDKACIDNPAIAMGANTCRGSLTCADAAKAFDLPFASIDTLVS